MAVSVTGALGEAIEVTQRTLFAPFRFSEWVALGFIAWLAGLGEGGGGSYQVPDLGSGSGSGSGANPFDDALTEVEQFLRDYAEFLVAGAIAILVFALVVGAALTWISSRGKLMFADAVRLRSFQVASPWGRWGELAQGLFWFRLLFGLALAAVVLGGLGAGAWLAWDDIQARSFGDGAVVGLAVASVALLPTVFVGAVVHSLLEDWVVPVMVVREERVMAAWRTVRREVLGPHLGAVILAWLLQLVMGVAVGLVMMLVTCITCCIAALPFVSTLVLLPWLVFVRAYPMLLLQQMGFAVFPPAPPGGGAAPAGGWAPGGGAAPAGGWAPGAGPWG